MMIPKRYFKYALLLVLISWIFLLDLPSRGDTQQEKNLTRRLPSRWELPDAIGKPGNREGGATRSPETECSYSNPTTFVALVPPSGKALTREAYPHFFWYLPATSARRLEFILKDDQQQEIYFTEYVLNANQDLEYRGLMSLRLPAFAGLAPLEVEREYSWKLVLICNGDDRSAHLVIEGTVERIAANEELDARLASATREEKVAIYAEERLWHETIDTLWHLHRSDPENSNLENAWKKLLDSVELQIIYQNSDDM